jgi:hypothetical protein
MESVIMSVPNSIPLRDVLKSTPGDLKIRLDCFKTRLDDLKIRHGFKKTAHDYFKISADLKIRPGCFKTGPVIKNMWE